MARNKIWENLPSKKTPLRAEDLQYYEKSINKAEERLDKIEEGGGTGGGHVILNANGQEMPQRKKLKAINMDVTDDETNDTTIIDGRGLQGKAATIEVGTVTTVESDQPAKVENVGTTSDAKFNFELPKGRNGTNGNDGNDGISVQSASSTYQVSTSGTVVPTETWLSSIPSVPKGQFLWTRTIITLTDNSTIQPYYSVSYYGLDGLGSGDMTKTVYDTKNRNKDIFDFSMDAIVEKDFTTLQDLTAWTNIPSNMEKVREGTIFRVLEDSSPDFKAVKNTTTGLFEAKPIEPYHATKINTTIEKNEITQQNFNENIVNNYATKTYVNSLQPSSPSTGTTAYIYLNSTTTFDGVIPSTTINVPYALTTISAVSKVFTYTFPTDAIISPTALYGMWVYFTGLRAQQDYVVSVSYKDGTQTISEGQLQFETGNQETVFQGKVPMPVNRLNGIPITALAGKQVQVTISLQRNGGNSHTPNLTSTPLFPTTFERNGGTESTANVMDFNGIDIKSQAVRNRQYESRMTALESADSAFLTKPVEVSKTLLVSDWVGTTAPYTYTLTSVTEVKSSKTLGRMVEIKQGATSNENYLIWRNAIQNADIQFANELQDVGKLVLKAWGTKPTIDLPILLLIGGEET